ncbi:MAG TPA: Trk system potassium transporter TrkA [Clostridiaceae bacterium]|nr:Trk system potassium transporter TrkA [Clostridiaceae bacterium]
MKIVISGLGKVGEVLARDLSHEKQDVIVIDRDEEKVEKLIMSVDVTGIAGSASFLDVQMEAGVDDCDVFIAVTPDDETNIIAGITAKKLGARYVICRVRSPEYSEQFDFLRESLGINMLINPDQEASREIENILLFPAALSVEHFGGTRVFMVQTVLSKDSLLAGKSLGEIGRGYGNVLIGVVERGDEVFIPDGSFILLAGDNLYLTGESREILRFLHTNNNELYRPKSALIVGGGRITRYLLARLNKHKIKVKVIEYDEVTANLLASEHPDAEIVLADGTDQKILREERMQNYDAVISLTGIDEENLLISLYAAQQGVKSTITKVNRTNLLKVLENVGLKAIVTPNKVIADNIIRFVRSLQNTAGSSIESFHRIGEGKVEALQFRVADDSKVCNQPLRDLETKPDILILCILRNNIIIFPDGNDSIQGGDSVIIVTKEPNFQDIADVLKEG